MGKKRIIQQSGSELLKESDKVDAKSRKEASVQSSQRVKEEQIFTSQKSREGKIFIFSSYNNTIMTLADLQGNVLYQRSAGAQGFKGARKATPFAASKVAESVAQFAKKVGIEKVMVFVKGIGSGRESAIRSLAGQGLDVVAIKDVTPVPHNGCRPPKVRRV